MLVVVVSRPPAWVEKLTYTKPDPDPKIVHARTRRRAPIPRVLTFSGSRISSFPAPRRERATFPLFLFFSRSGGEARESDGGSEAAEWSRRRPCSKQTQQSATPKGNKTPAPGWTGDRDLCAKGPSGRPLIPALHSPPPAVCPSLRPPLPSSLGGGSQWVAVASREVSYRSVFFWLLRVLWKSEHEAGGHGTSWA